MAQTTEIKEGIIQDYRVHETDTGSTEVQVALLTQTDQRAHRALQDPHQGPPRSPRSAQARRSRRRRCSTTSRVVTPIAIAADRAPRSPQVTILPPTAATDARPIFAIAAGPLRRRRPRGPEPRNPTNASNRSPSRSAPARSSSRPVTSPSRPRAPCLVRLGDTVVLTTACTAVERHPARLPAAHRRLPRVHLRRRPHSGRLLQARGSTHREGDDHLASHRPAAAAALPRRLHQRDPGHRPGALGRRRERPGHPGDQRCLRRAGALRASPSTTRSAPCASA